MAETLLPFQCNHVEGLWKNTNKKKNTKPKREKVEKVQFFFPIYYYFFSYQFFGYRSEKSPKLFGVSRKKDCENRSRF